MATEAIGSALVLNVMLWLALLISIPSPVCTHLRRHRSGRIARLFGAAPSHTRSPGWRAGGTRRAVCRRRIPRWVRTAWSASSARSATRWCTSPRTVRFSSGPCCGGTQLAPRCGLVVVICDGLRHFVDPVELFAATASRTCWAPFPSPWGLGVIEASAATCSSPSRHRNIATLPCSAGAS